MSREAMKQALEALEQIECYTFHPAKVFPWKATIAALRAALDAPEPEPVAWMYDFLDPDNRDNCIRNWITQSWDDIERERGFNVRPLYFKEENT